MEIKAPPPNRIKAVIVEDERKSLLTLQALLDKYCPDVMVIGSARSVAEGLQVLTTLKPDLVFMDIAMPDGDAFDLLKKLPAVDFEIIFVTAYNDFALKAFEFSTLHYLLKPINYLDLQLAVERFNRLKPKNNIRQRLEVLNQALQNNFMKISLPTLEGLIVVDVNTIVRIEASSNYSIFLLNSGDRQIVSKSLNQFEDILSGLGFFRIHNTHMINMIYVKKYHRGRGGMVSLTDGSQVSVSAGRKKEFLERLGDFSLNLVDPHNQT